MAFTLKIDQPLCLIGIQIFPETLIHIRKSLSPGWYPFVHTKENIGVDKEKRPVVSSDVCPVDFYNIENGLPRITITAIVGKNGSGKSSILDILYRILNNFAVATFTEKIGESCEEVLLTRGLYARLYFQQDGVQRYIDVQDDKVSYFEYDGSEHHERKIYGLNDDERAELLNRFFYTISVNYSIYAFNPQDYNTPLDKSSDFNQKGGEWLDFLFHKNDGYYVPIVLTPFRNEGEMNLVNESKLAEQRISVLSLLYFSQSKNFLEDYVPYRLSFKFDQDYKYNKMVALRQKIRYPELRICLDIILRHFEVAWQKYFAEKNIELTPDYANTELFYLAYKAFKICITYLDYQRLFPIKDLISLAVPYADWDTDFQTSDVQSHKNNNKKDLFVKSDDCSKWMKEHTDCVKSVINAILNDAGHHVTAKIFQCLKYIEGKHYKHGTEVMINDLISRKYDNYDDILFLMPPPFFRTELYYIKKNDRRTDPEQISLRYMSSGEKQLLYSLSYVYYHLRNIASNKRNGKRIVGYHHINLIFDEAELYYHPEFQRTFVKRLLERLAMCHINRSSIRSIHIMIVTHSPFILSDIPESNVLYLGTEGHCLSRRTFGANIYDLLQDSFFLKSDLGEIACSKINEMINLYNSEDEDDKKNQVQSKYAEFEFVLNHLGEEYLKKTYGYMLDRLRSQYIETSEKNRLVQELEKIEKRRAKLIKQLKNEGCKISDKSDR